MLAELGKLEVVLDGNGVAKAVVEITELTKRRFDEIDAAFAFDEGEGELSLEYWRDCAKSLKATGRFPRIRTAIFIESGQPFS